MHTPGEWTVEKSENGFRILKKATRELEPDVLVAQVFSLNETGELDANYIVQMHNSFDGLLEACKEFMKFYDNSSQAMQDLMEPIVDIIRPAIKKAENNN